jgi:hypothetical protein
MYVKIRSWHGIRSWTRVPNRCKTYCGQTVMTVNAPGRGETAEGFGTERTCETCLRIMAKG